MFRAWTSTFRCAFEDHGRYYIVTDIVPGVRLKELPEDKKASVIKELEGYVAQMHTIKSKVMGGFLGDVIVPYRVGKAVPHDQILKLREATKPEFVQCRNDLGQQKVIVDEKTLKINAIRRLGVCWVLSSGVRSCLLPSSWTFRSA